MSKDTAQAQPTDHPPGLRQRRVRLTLCRAVEDLRMAIAQIEASEGDLGELQNLATLTLRMALRLNDGHVSPPERMRGF